MTSLSYGASFQGVNGKTYDKNQESITSNFPFLVMDSCKIVYFS